MDTADDDQDANHVEDMTILSAVLRGVDITEVFSPERVTLVCHKYRLTPGESFDLRNGYDLSDKEVQKEVIHKNMAVANAQDC